MSEISFDPKKSIRLFESDFWEWTSHVHPLTPLLVWGPPLAFLVWMGVGALPVQVLLTAMVVGWFIWTFVEYVLHRFVFHFNSKSRFGKYAIYRFHGVHHDQPNDPTRLVMPPIASIPIGLAFYAIFYLAAGATLSYALFAGFLIGYLCYDYVHYAVHHIRPRTAIGRFLKQNHMAHHYVEHDRKFGVSSPIWDFVFSTRGSRKA